MAVVGELEGLVRNHDLLISRGTVVDAAKIKGLVSEYMSRNDMYSRFYKPIREKLEELLFCAETNFEKFQEVLNYKQITQLEYFYPEYFKEFSRDLNQSAQGRFNAGYQLYSGLLTASSLHSDRKILLKSIEHFLIKRDYHTVHAIFERLDETRRTVLAFNAEAGIDNPVPLIQDQSVSLEAGKMLFKAYSEETARLEGPNAGYSFARNAYLLADIMSAYFSEQELITDSTFVSAGTLYFKELTRRADIDNTAELIKFVEQFRSNPATQRFHQESPELFANYMNSVDVRESMNELMLNLLGKTRFDEARTLAQVLEGMMSFDSIFHQHLGTLKENRFYVQAIEMAEKMKMKDMLTDDLKVEALRTLMTDYSESPLKSNLKRVKNFCQRHGINAQSFPHIGKEVREQLEQLERYNPDLEHDLDQLYRLFKLPRERKEQGNVFVFKLFEPIIMFFVWFFKLFLRLATGGYSSAQSKKAPVRRRESGA